LLPVPYFLVTCTVPDPLRRWIRSHLENGLDALFAASAQALQDWALQPRRLGAQLGFLGVLHTGSRTLIFHPHVHYLVPGGGLSPDGRSWVAAKAHYLFDVKALGARCRTLFHDTLVQQDPALLQQIPARVWKQKWVVHCQPAGSGENTLRYLSRYVFRTATANRWVSLLPNGRVRWLYRNSTTGREESIDLEPHELLSRFLQHVLPSGYHRVRLFGWLHLPAGRQVPPPSSGLTASAPCSSRSRS
jgi:hypothetical protein